MTVKHDLTGNRYGRWFVIKQGPTQTEPQHRARYWCKCDCGTERLVLLASLVRGLSTSCGCRQRESLVVTHEKTRKDITGQRFGMLMAVRRVQIKPVKWMCVCDCGNSRVLPMDTLGQGRVWSCGCARKILKLSSKDVTAIRDLYKLDDYTLLRIAKIFNVDQSHISRIVNGKARQRG